MIIVTYTSENYKPVLDVVLHSWQRAKPDKILVYTDTDLFGIKLFKNQTTDYDMNCLRKVYAIMQALKDNDRQNILYLDSDCYLRELPNQVFDDYRNFDIACTRMVRRKREKREINAGVSFWRASWLTVQFCQKWLELAGHYMKQGIKDFPEQKAFNNLCYQFYDNYQSGMTQVINVSEEMYNYERDSAEEFLADMPKNAHILHLKQGLWKDKHIVRTVQSLPPIDKKIYAKPRKS